MNLPCDLSSNQLFFFNSANTCLVWHGIVEDDFVLSDHVIHHVTDHVMYCRSWPPQGQLPACFNTDMSSSKVYSEVNSSNSLPLHISCVIQVNVLLETLKDVLANNECDRPPKW